MQCSDHIVDTPTIYIDTYITPIEFKTIETKSGIKSRYNEKHSITYYCNYIKCNSRNITDQVRETVNAHYDLSAIRSILNYVYKKPTTKTSSLTPVSRFFTSLILSTLLTTSSSLDSTYLPVNYVSYTSVITTSNPSIVVHYSSKTSGAELTGNVPSSTNRIFLTDRKSSISYPSQLGSSTNYLIIMVNEFTSKANISETSTSATSGSHTVEKYFNIQKHFIVWITLKNLMCCTYFRIGVN